MRTAVCPRRDDRAYSSLFWSRRTKSGATSPTWITGVLPTASPFGPAAAADQPRTRPFAAHRRDGCLRQPGDRGSLGEVRRLDVAGPAAFRGHQPDHPVV